jgi:hypothetical protein
MNDRTTYFQVELQGYLYKDVREVNITDKHGVVLDTYYQFRLRVQRPSSYEYSVVKPGDKKGEVIGVQEVTSDLIEVTYKYENGSELKNLKTGDLIKVTGYAAIQPEFMGKGVDRTMVMRTIITNTKGAVPVPVTKVVVRAQSVTKQPKPVGVIDLG